LQKASAIGCGRNFCEVDERRMTSIATRAGSRGSVAEQIQFLISDLVFQIESRG